MVKYDVIIIGAGATGIAASWWLTSAGKNVCILEAADKTGGRVATVLLDGFLQPVETGAEFLHGHPPITISLLEEAGIPYTSVEGTMAVVRNSVWLDTSDDNEEYPQLLEKIGQLKEDCTIREFLDNFFPAGEYDNLRSEIFSFAEGFMLADTSEASVFSLQREMKHRDEDQFRIYGGYAALLEYLLKKCPADKLNLQLSSPVTRVEHDNGIRAYTSTGQCFHADLILVTASPAVLVSDQIQFVPAIPAIKNELQKIGFGSVLKILFQFSEPFWQSRDENLGFILGNEFIPVWWTQHPEKSNLLTGWLGGPRAAYANQLPGDELYEKALESLAAVFLVDKEKIRSLLLRQKIVCWDQQRYILGGYSYNKTATSEAREKLNDQNYSSIFFAGEALYEGPFAGTVEAALSSAMRAAEQILTETNKRYNT